MWLTFHRILRALSETNRRKTSRRARVSTYRPRLEALEDRTLLSAYVVTTTADNGDNTNPIAGSLRDAINQVNAGTYNEIDFNITAASDTAGGGTGYNATTGVATIQPPTALPPITNSVIINGYTQGQSTSLTATPNTLAVGDNAVIKIELLGNSTIATGLELSGSSSSGSTIEGLSVNSFGSFESGSMIHLNASNSDTIQGNFIGLDASGESSPTSLVNFSSFINTGQNGIQLQDAQNDLIGTNGDGVNDPAERNVISNLGVGVGFLSSSSNNIVAGNYIGTDASGTKGIGNWQAFGFSEGCSSNQIGTNGTDADAAGEGNVISGNVHGIAFASGAVGSPAETGGTVEGNIIGPDAYGNKLNCTSGILSWQGNLQVGIAALELDSGIQIGGSNPVQANIIAYNQGPGISLPSLENEYATHITIQGNSIHDNLGAGIDEGGAYSASTGLTQGPDNASSLSIADGTGTGPNGLQHYPPLTSAQAGSSTTTISGLLNTNNSGPYILDFYDNGSSPDPSGFGQGQTYLGSASITNTGSFLVILPVATAAGDYLTATATDAAGDTSIFSNDIQAAAPPTGQTLSQNLQTVVDQSSPPSQVTLQTSASLSQDTIISAVNSLTAPSSPVTITLDLNGGTYDDTTVNPPPNVTLVIDGISGTNTFVGHSPAFTVTGGNVIVRNVTFITTTDAPTILVTGGSLTLRNDIVQESTGYTDAAIAITGGTLDLGTTSDPGGNTLNINGSGSLVQNATSNPVTAVGSAYLVNGAALAPDSLSGIIFKDFNDDGQVDFGEQGIAGVAVTLTGTDFLGNAVSMSATTDSDGAYIFANLQPGTYSITETQPAGYNQGINTVGTAGGSLTVTDQFFVSLAQDTIGLNGLNYNFGEQPQATGSVQKGQTAGIGFWNNKNGQALINNFNGGPASTQLAAWLADTLPHIFGVHAGSNALIHADGSYFTNTEVAARFQQDFVLKGTKLDAQVLATALSVYATNATLDNTGVAANYGFLVSSDGVGTAGVNVGSNGDAFGVANNTVVTVLDLLKATDALAVEGLLYNGDAVKRKEANSVYSAINDAGNIG